MFSSSVPVFVIFSLPTTLSLSFLCFTGFQTSRVQLFCVGWFFFSRISSRPPPLSNLYSQRVSRPSPHTGSRRDQAQFFPFGTPLPAFFCFCFPKIGLIRVLHWQTPPPSPPRKTVPSGKCFVCSLATVFFFLPLLFLNRCLRTSRFFFLSTVLLPLLPGIG